jgi:hypothetical protein
VRALKPRADAELQGRVGIATGLVVVGDLIGAGAAQEQAVVGETPNLAARLQTIAEPDSVIIAASTRRLTGGLFEYENLGAVVAKGFAEPVVLGRGESALDSRFEALRSGKTPLIGREEEVDLLLRRWQRAKSGEGQVVSISGEPGIGKSRLTAALQDRIAHEDAADGTLLRGRRQEWHARIAAAPERLPTPRPRGRSWSLRRSSRLAVVLLIRPSSASPRAAQAASGYRGGRAALLKPSTSFENSPASRGVIAPLATPCCISGNQRCGPIPALMPRKTAWIRNYRLCL